jgi:flagellar basal body-associated protein FliL
MLRYVTLLIVMLLPACGGEAGGGGDGSTASSGSSKKKDKEEFIEEGYCVHTFQTELLDQSGRAQVQVCLVTNTETREYILKHDDFAEKIRQSFIRIVERNSLGELEMPDASGRIRQEMLDAVQQQIKPLVVDDVKLQQWELW